MTTTLGTFARENRKALRLNQQEVADLAEVSERFVREFEAGKETVQLNKVIAVLRVLGFDLIPQVHTPILSP
ncbi:type II toxin-antitoxin system Y4mF family antitoxin [Corynebacterium mastitidis]|uniref:type II toxin-antitoxin system Y4mF family antitoxin n=1 Tax=Corynebacterium mastitidis TaxID=161890 RepID=UPI002549C2AE|nr:type II toxin-antitoxin system Y4mF family antitoxin [Corynebacterium mastitidis]MDK8449996.1 type II toxin-antitoxin system Y4mF family antitoxin [Corynebacterium mastitidis]